MVALCGAPVVWGGTIRHDVADANYTALAADYPSVGRVFVSFTGHGAYTGSGVLIADGWVLTAGHMVHNPGAPYNYTTTDLNYASSNTGFQFSNGGITAGAYRFATVVAEPGWLNSAVLNGGYDLALIRLTSLVSNVDPAVRYAGSAELNNVGTMVGFGATGNGNTGYNLNTTGTKRAGQNMIDSIGGSTFYTQGYSSNTLVIDFDDPPPGNSATNRSGTNTALDLEYSTAPGDSGGGIFINDNGVNTLVGITSFGFAYDGGANSSYGDLAGFTRVSVFNAWIDSVMAANADTMTWTAGSSSFNTASNWTSTSLGATVPGTMDHALFDSTGSRTITYSNAITNANATFRRGTTTLSLAGNTYHVTNHVAVADTASAATLVLANGTVSAATLGVGATGTLAGSGTVVAAVTNAGHVAPGTSVGAINITGSYTQTLTGTLAIEIASLASFDTLTVTSTADLAGSLTVTLLGGYTPDLADTFTVLTAAAITGTLDFNSPVFDSIFYFAPQMSPTALTLAIAYAQLEGDANNDGVVDAADYLAVESNFGTLGDANGLLVGDANDDGRVDGSDWFTIEQHFGAQWTGPGLVVVPEPGTLVCMLFALVSVGRRCHS